MVIHYRLSRISLLELFLLFNSLSVLVLLSWVTRPSYFHSPKTPVSVFLSPAHSQTHIPLSATARAVRMHTHTHWHTHMSQLLLVMTWIILAFYLTHLRLLYWHLFPRPCLVRANDPKRVNKPHQNHHMSAESHQKRPAFQTRPSNSGRDSLEHGGNGSTHLPFHISARTYRHSRVNQKDWMTVSAQTRERQREHAHGSKIRNAGESGYLLSGHIYKRWSIVMTSPWTRSAVARHGPPTNKIGSRTIKISRRAARAHSGPFAHIQNVPLAPPGFSFC